MERNTMKQTDDKGKTKRICGRRRMIKERQKEFVVGD
jgi:hypothetical protein